MKYEYPSAGENAPPEVKRAIAKFRRLPIAQKESVPLLYWLLGSGTPDYKMSKEDAEYVDQSEIDFQNCANCISAFQHVTSGEFICDQMEGEIQGEAWCKLWAPYEG